MRKGAVRKAVPQRLKCPSLHPQQPFYPRHPWGPPGPGPLGRIRSAGTSFLCSGTTWRPEAMHCHAGLRDFLQQPSGRTGLCGNAPRRAPCCLARVRVRPSRRQKGALLKAKGTLGKGPMQEVGALSSLGLGTSRALPTGLQALGGGRPPASSAGGAVAVTVAGSPDPSWPSARLLFASSRHDIWDLRDLRTCPPPHQKGPLDPPAPRTCEACHSWPQTAFG